MRASQQRCTLFAVLLLAASVASALSNWELPAGTNPTGVVPAPLPQGMVGPITFTESEFPDGTVIDGLVVTTLDGDPLPAPLGFGFSSADATIDGGQNLTYVQIPNIEGDATGTLTIDFGLSATSVTFGFALACGGTVTDGASAQAFDAHHNPVGSPASVDALDFGGGFPENQLTLAPGGSFRSAEITFNSANGCFRFAFDNLAYDGQPVPALPLAGFAALALMLLATGYLALSRRRT